MRLKYQLFLVLLLASALLIALMAGFSRWSFDRGFLGYVAEVDRQRLEPLTEALAEGYALNESWDWVADDRSTWRALLKAHAPERRRGGPRDSCARDGEPRRGERGETPQSDDRAPRDSRPAPPSGGAGPLASDARLLLADVERRVLIGRTAPGRTVRWQPIALDGETVGFLGRCVRDAEPGGIDEAFASQQRRGFVWAALAMVGLSALLAAALASRLIRPLVGVADAVERIGCGEYAHRVPAERADEMGDLARDVNRLAASLESSLEARRRWLAEISHELRTPVAILRGELEAIQDGVQELDSAAVDSLHAEALRLGRLIDDLHTFTLSDAGALDYRFETVDLAGVVAERLNAGRTGAAERGIDVELVRGTAPLPVRGDAQRLGQLVDNLLQNSLRYTDPGGTVRVTLARDAGRSIIDWSDSTPGVEAIHLPRLFEPLYRADASRHRAHGGAGLGLAIVGRIVEAHGGTATAHPSPLGGLTIRIELPADTGDTL